MSPLNGWESFYVIIGSSAGALTGLQFVVITLIADARRGFDTSSAESIDAFGTPTIVHFCVALLVSAILSAPWDRMSYVEFAVAATGVGGLIYTGIIIRRARRQTGYQPVFEDWLWHAALPLVTYVAILAAGVLLARHVTGALFTIATASLVLVFIGIHNAWDTVTYITVTRILPPADSPPAGSARDNSSSPDNK